MIRYFYGEDTYAAREAITAFVREAKAQVRFLDAEELDEKSLTEIVERGSGGLFGKELVVIREPAELSQTVQEMLAEAAQRGAGAELLLWDSGEPDTKSILFQRLKKEGKRFTSLTGKQMEDWLAAQAEERGVTLAPDSGRLLVQRLGSDRWRLLSELERLSLSGEDITAARVEKEVAPAADEGEIFAMLRAVAAGKRAHALNLLLALLASGNSEFYIVSMLTYQFRTLHLVARGITAGVSPKALSVLRDVARQRPASAWLADLTRVVATDFAIKQGNVDARTAVTMLVLGLVQQGQRIQ